MMDNKQAKYLYDVGKPIRDESTKRSLRLQTHFLPTDALPKQRLWHLVYNTNDIPTCKMCDKTVNWNSANSFVNQRYNVYCGRQCSLSDPGRKAKQLATELIKYGKGRIEIVNKIKKTNNERYGTDFAIQTDEYQNKQKQTILEKYGVDNYAKTDEFIKQREETNIKRYGYKHPAQSPSFKRKTKETLISKYDGHQGQRHFSDISKKLYNDKNWLYEQHITKKRTASDIANELQITVSAIINKIKSFNIQLHYYNTSQSLLEKQLCSFIQSFDIKFIENDRFILSGNKELDVYIPTKKIAIEFDGIYWHGELQGRDKKYHINKTYLCREKGIQLLHIFETDWVLKQPVVKSIILNKLGKTKNIIYARKCKIVELDNITTKTFLNNNHIQGSISSSISLGLTYNDNLVCVLTLSKSRYSKNHEYEIYRFCNILNTSVVGGANKLFKHFIKLYNPKSVITYADRRFGEGLLYDKMGFNFTHNSAPNYKYFKRGQIELHSRIKFQKHKLFKILEHFNPALTEWQNMVNNGYDRIWDCGNVVWEWKK